MEDFFAKNPLLVHFFLPLNPFLPKMSFHSPFKSWSSYKNSLSLPFLSLNCFETSQKCYRWKPPTVSLFIVFVSPSESSLHPPQCLLTTPTYSIPHLQWCFPLFFGSHCTVHCKYWLLCKKSFLIRIICLCINKEGFLPSSSFHMRLDIQNMAASCSLAFEWL